LRLSRTITRQCGIKFSWEFKRGPDAEIRDKKTKHLCGIYILHLADIILSGENIPERIPGEGKQHKFGMNKRMELKQKVTNHLTPLVRRDENDKRKLEPVLSVHVDTEDDESAMIGIQIIPKKGNKSKTKTMTKEIKTIYKCTNVYSVLSLVKYLNWIPL
jgi:hypothetical protein